MDIHGTLHFDTPAAPGLRFTARFASGAATVLESGDGERAANPMEALLGALAACEAIDVVTILRKKRIAIASYEVAMSGERDADPPRRYRRIVLTHVLAGPAIPAAAVAEALRLSAAKYCSVHHSLDPAMAVENRFEIRTA